MRFRSIAEFERAACDLHSASPDTVIYMHFINIILDHIHFFKDSIMRRLPAGRGSAEIEGHERL